MADQIHLMKEMTAIMENVADGPSARAAKPDFEALKTKMDALKARLKKLGSPSSAVQRALRNRYDDQIKEVMAGTMKNVGKMTQPAIDEELGELLKSCKPPIGW